MKIKFNITIDMLLDGYLKLVLIDQSNDIIEQVGSWSENNLRRRDNDSFSKYYPVAEQTELEFRIEVPDNLKLSSTYIDLLQSKLEIGYSGSRKAWVGPGKLFEYSLDCFVDSKENLLSISNLILDKE